MILEFLLFFGIVGFIHWWEYNSSIQEYTFAQPATLERHGELSVLLQEKSPIAVEIGTLPWRPIIAEKSVWPVETSDGVTQPVSKWMSSPEFQQSIVNGHNIAENMSLDTGLTDLDAGRPWWWLPGLHDLTVDILRDSVYVLSWVTSERHWIGCTSGAPITVWLVHSRYRQYLPKHSDINPWTLTVADAPWIGRVQYVEILVKPGWCLGIPAHWGFAAKVEEDPSLSWLWTANQHSLFSLALSRAQCIQS